MESSISETKKVRKPRKSKNTNKQQPLLHENLQNEVVEEDKKVPKKRGRKPKGGKLIKSEKVKQEIVEEEPNIIIHLKCKLQDIVQGHNEALNNASIYDPNVCNVEPYTNNEDTFTFIEGKNNVDETQLHSIQEPAQTQTQEKQNIMTDEVTIKEEKIRLHEKKVINNKLKELEMNLNQNNINKRSACFWCTYEFNSNPIYIPSLFFQKKYDVYGCFCSPECACSYLFNQNIDDNTKYERYQMLNYIYGKIYNYTKNIKPAPNPFYSLSKFYGNLSIQEYRQLLEYDRLLLVIDKPLSKIYPEMHEDNNDFETIYENKISLKRTNKIDKNKVLNKVFQSSS